MATAIDIFSLSAKANSDLSAKQFYAVKLTAADVVDVPSAATDFCIGLVVNAPKINQATSVQVLGIGKASSDGSGTAIAVNDRVGPNSIGQLVKKATADYNAMGIALDASSAAGTIIRVLLIPGLVFRTLAG
jgi:hypothetical protein